MENQKNLFLKDDLKTRNWSIIADFVSIANGLAGILAIYTIFVEALYLSIRLMGLGLLLDFLDGQLARRSLLPSKRRKGIYIDSVSDGITFGLFPAALCLAIVQESWFVVVAAVGYVGSTWFRLVRFTRESSIERFRGLPSPGAAAFTSSFLILFQMPTALVVAVFIVVAILMASTIQYPSFKNPCGAEKLLLGMTGIVTGLLVVLPASVWLPTLFLFFLLSCIYLLVGPFWIR
ncbi:MAG: CDP-alcohol phosphatidyltransferase family protein [Candidatus Heimdallarchaeota archaeon]